MPPAINRRPSPSIIPYGGLEVRVPTREPKSAKLRSHTPTAPATEEHNVTHPIDGFGFREGSAQISAMGFLAKFTDQFRAVRANPDAVITATIGTSGSGSRAANDRVMEKRIAAVRQMLRDAGFQGTVRIKQERAPLTGKDDPTQRTVRFHFGASHDRIDTATCRRHEKLLELLRGI